ncbi:mucoidy inhibitor MuiA family protein [Roseiconus nitratireducens]|uniref:Mucoidy inhibitor MuiA family protein n=1 Tax=Roseiconus nitratireducens TaxID=2605748 RepID=A0A5M6DHC3_9BACT|nr:DUF4139 domain-containing protein [Roseiconus nitratireducens]KAA5546921.1 mucoidy inhibitor MuiA family protein [Roseiconus nitratireducens]
MRQVIGWCCLLVGCLELNAAEDSSKPNSDVVQVASRVSSVTVFRREANVIRTADIVASDQRQLVRVTGLPETLRDQSVRCESDSGLVVRSLRLIPHRSPTVNAEQKEQDNTLRKLHDAVASAKQEVLVIEQDLETIDALVQFSAVKASAELNSAKLDTAGITEIADFVMQRRRALAKELLDAKLKVDAQQTQLESKLAEYSESSDAAKRPTYDVILDVNAPQGGQLRLSYWVDAVGWEPSYTIHATSNPQGDDHFVIELEGKITQNTGEDWNSVDLVLCTGVPDLKADGPVLAPLRVSVNASEAESSDPFQRSGRGETGHHGALSGAMVTTWDDPMDWQETLRLNSEAARQQLAEFNQSKTSQRDLASDATQTISDETYEVGTSIDVASQSGGQSITILRSTVSSSIYRVVVPLLSSFAYREVEVENLTGQNLVSGEAAVFLDGQFVGRTTLPPTAAGGELLIGLGADRQVRTRRELLDRTVSIKGGNRLATLDYRLVVSNFHDQPVAVRLLDRLPVSNSSGVINVIVDPASLGNLSTDGKYLRLRRPTGILRWDLEIPPRRFGSEAYDHDYQYTIEMDRTQSIISTNLQQQLKEDLRFQRASGGGMGGGMGGFMGSGQ